MATGDPIVVIYSMRPASTNGPGEDETSAGVSFLAYDDSTTESARWECYMTNNYDGTSNIRVRLPGRFSTFVGNQTCNWAVQVAKVRQNVDSVDSLTFATAVAASAAEASTSQVIRIQDVTLTNAQADGVTANEHFILKVARTGGTGSSGDFWLFRPTIDLA